MPVTGFEIAVVSDHALLRYLERKHGLDVESLRAEIREACRDGVRFGAKAVLADGVKFIIADDTVVTCLERRRTERKGKG